MEIAENYLLHYKNEKENFIFLVLMNLQKCWKMGVRGYNNTPKPKWRTIALLVAIIVKASRIKECWFFGYKILNIKYKSLIHIRIYKSK
jgi:hypothetical protein